MTPIFDLAHEPWIPVRYTDGTIKRVGWRDLLADSAIIADIDVDPPITYPVIIRMATAILLQSHDAPTTSSAVSVWQSWATGLLASGPSAAAVDAYLQTWADRFWLIHPDTPFLQDPAIAVECSKASTTNKLLIDAASGNNFLWWSKTPDVDAPLVDHASAALALLAQWGYGSGGRCASRIDETGETKADGKQGPLRPRTQFLPKGSNLWQTLLACTAPASGDEALAGRDVCWWELQPGDSVAPGQLGRLTASPRGLLLVGDVTGVSNAVVTWGAELDDDFWSGDMFTATRHLKDGTTAPYRLSLGKVAWAEAPALLAKVDQDGERQISAPRILDAARNPLGLTDEFFHSGVTVVTHFADKSKDLDWSRSELPGLIANLEALDSSAYNRVNQYCRYASELIAATAKLAGRIELAGGDLSIAIPDSSSFGRQLWIDAEAGFWRTTGGVAWEHEARVLAQNCRQRFESATGDINDPRLVIGVINAQRRLSGAIYAIGEKFALTNDTKGAA